jgi:hypothetical protein
MTTVDSFDLRKVLYEQASQEELVKTMVRGGADAVHAVLGDDVSPEDPRVNQALGATNTMIRDWVFGDFALRFKSSGFQEEKEWRAVVLRPAQRPDTSELDFHIRRGRFVPHVPLNVTSTVGLFNGRLPINAVRYGPTPHPDLAFRSLFLLLDKHGYRWPSLTLSGSKIPYRT